MGKLRILCLHGSRQDGEIFSQRISKLRAKLSDIADLVFVDAPHELPLQEGQSVAMRTWWRHWALSDPEPSSTPDSNASMLRTAVEVTAADVAAQAQHLHDVEHQLSAGGWSARVATDWQASLACLDQVWHDHGGFDAILGFSNGAAAGFLLAAHVAGAPPGSFLGRRLRCCVLASGYVPQPLRQLLPPGTSVDDMEVLSQPLKVASLHLVSGADKVVPLADSRTLAAQFDAGRRQVLEHDSGHCVPQKANHCDLICDFLSWFEPPPDDPPPLPQQQPPVLSAPVMAPKVTTPAPQPAAMPCAPPKPSEPQPSGPPPSQEQQEEVEALQAIFDTSFEPVGDPLTCAPPRFRILLTDPGDAPPDTYDASGQAVPLTPAHFALLVTLPDGYPASGGPLPTVELEGPVRSNDPLRGALASHLQGVAREEVDATGAGCCYQIVEAAKAWLETALAQRADSGTAEEGDAGGGGAAGLAGAADTEIVHAWWENEEADGALVTAAIADAAAAQWSWVAAAEAAAVAGAGADVAVSDTGSSATEDADGVQRGRWDYTVGLVGKPSAGKSSFFNAVTSGDSGEEGARVAAHPFTTISPNVARGFVAIPDPTYALGLSTSDCKPTYGYAAAFDPRRADPALNNIAPLTRWVDATGWKGKDGRVAWRRVPVVVKDVAGLVPGAYAGRGRGNAFLNDLCDADVLIHVVDASGCTDREGRPAKDGEGADPLGDVNWVREELHRWVYDNVRVKWAVVRRRPTRLAELFSGYHASRALVGAVLERRGVAPSLLAACEAAGPGTPGVGGRPGGPPNSPLLSWGEADLHALVATFLAARFPLLLALNKADLPPASAHIARVRATLPTEPCVAVSAASERWLIGARKAGDVVYADGSSEVCVPSGHEVDPGTARRVSEINSRVLGRFGSSGAMLALATAVAMRPPRVVFPVADVASCVAMPSKAVASGTGVLMGAEDAKLRAAEGTQPSVLRDALLLKPGSTPADVYTALKKPPWQLLEGEFVRAEARLLGSSGAGAGNCSGTVTKAVLKKDEVLDWSNCVVRIMTNRKK